MPLDNATLARRFYNEAWNKQKLNVVDELVSSTHALYDPSVQGSQSGPEVYKRRISEISSAFPDLRFVINETISEGEKVAVSWNLSGTHKGEYFGVPGTGKTVSVDGTTIHHFANGKILDSFVCWDHLGLLRQLGIVQQALEKPVQATPQAEVIAGPKARFINQS